MRNESPISVILPCGKVVPYSTRNVADKIKEALMKGRDARSGEGMDSIAFAIAQEVEEDVCRIFQPVSIIGSEDLGDLIETRLIRHTDYVNAAKEYILARAERKAKRESIRPLTSAGLESLPVFARNPLFEKRTRGAEGDVPVFEIARLTFRTVSDTVPPYVPEELTYVMGRSRDCGEIFGATSAMRRVGGGVLAVNNFDATHPLDVEYIGQYRIITSNEKVNVRD